MGASCGWPRHSPEWECSAGVGELQFKFLTFLVQTWDLSLLHPEPVYISFIWADLQQRFVSKESLLMNKKVFEQKPETRYLACSPRREWDMLLTLAGSAALGAVINKSLNRNFSLALSLWQLCMLCRPERAGRDQGYSHPTEWCQQLQMCTSQHPNPEHSGRGESAVSSADLFWERFSPWIQRHAVPWMMHNNGIAAIGANSFLSVRKELWNSVSKIREKFLRQPVFWWACYKWLPKLWAE